MNTATSALVACKETYKPRRSGGAASIRKAVLGPTSPPNAKPCKRRNAIASTGAQIPIDAYGGMSGKPITPTPIKPKERSIAGFRPTRSPKRPITRAPSGRVKKPTPNVASDASRLVPGVFDGKNARPICAAKNA
jgi:hypothetical protein